MTGGDRVTGATARIVVGVDGSDESRRAAQWALEEARLRRASLHVVHAFPETYIVPHGPSIPSLVRSVQNASGRPEAALEASLAGILNGDVPVRRELVPGPAAPALLAAARGADLLVVGSRGRGGFSGLFLGSVSQQVASHAPCPVVVVTGEQTGDETATFRGQAGREEVASSEEVSS